MAPSRHLLLYADGNSTAIDGNYTSLDGNFTIDCIADCIGVCIYNVCLPSPPLSPASLPFEDGSKPTPVSLHSRDHLLPTLIITATSAVVGSFVLLMALYSYIRFRRRRRRRLSPPDAAEDSVIDDGDDLLPGGGEIEHHIWYIRTQGLDDSTISSIASWVYKSGEGFVDGKDCSVCLGEFIDGDLVRLLPKCSHAFHLPCIDMWLRSHVNCPLCRAPIVPPSAAAVPAAPSPPMAVNTEQAEPEAGSSVQVESIQIEALPWESNIDGTEIRIVIHGSSSSSSELQLSSPKGEEELQPIRRSVSLDSFSLDDDLSREGIKEGELLQEEEEGLASANWEKSVQGFNLKGKFRFKGRAKMERSLSSQSARWFFPRSCRILHPSGRRILQPSSRRRRLLRWRSSSSQPPLPLPQTPPPPPMVIFFLSTATAAAADTTASSKRSSQPLLPPSPPSPTTFLSDASADVDVPLSRCCRCRLLRRRPSSQPALIVR